MLNIDVLFELLIKSMLMIGWEADYNNCFE